MLLGAWLGPNVRVDERVGQMRQVAQGLVLDAVALAVAATKQVRAIDLVLVLASRGDDVSNSGSCMHVQNNSRLAQKRQVT